MKRILFFPFAALMGVVAAMAQKDFILESGTDITVSYPAVARPCCQLQLGFLMLGDGKMGYNAGYSFHGRMLALGMPPGGICQVRLSLLLAHSSM